MAEVTVQHLDPRLQRLVEHARISMERRNFEYVIEMAQTVLEKEPRSLQARRLLRAAQLERAKSGNGFLAKTLGGIAGAGALVAGTAALRKEPMKALVAAEKALDSDPTNIAAHRLLGQAASRLEWHETAVFAWETARDLQPGVRGHRLALGNACVAAGRHGEAVKIADGLLGENPGDPEAQTLLGQASVADSIVRGNWQPSGSNRPKPKDEAGADANSGRIKAGGSAKTNNPHTGKR